MSQLMITGKSLKAHDKASILKLSGYGQSHNRRCHREPVFSSLSALTEIHSFCEESEGMYLRMPFKVGDNPAAWPW